MMRKLAAEFIGTFMLVAAAVGTGAIGSHGSYAWVAFAIGISVMVMAFAVGHVSGGHFNPAVTCGLVAAGRHPVLEAVPYIIAQVLGGAAAAAIYYFIATNKLGAPLDFGNFASNTYGGPEGFPIVPAALVEVVATALFLFVIVGATSVKAPPGLAPVAIGFALVIVLLITIPVTNGSINPARSTAAALFGGTEALACLPLFWAAPIVGGILGGLIGRVVQGE